MTEKKMRVNIWDLPRDLKISKGEMQRFRGGNYLSSPYATTYYSDPRIGDLVSYSWRPYPYSQRPLSGGKFAIK
jgi:hypothetical protein